MPGMMKKKKVAMMTRGGKAKKRKVAMMTRGGKAKKKKMNRGKKKK